MPQWNLNKTGKIIKNRRIRRNVHRVSKSKPPVSIEYHVNVCYNIPPVKATRSAAGRPFVAAACVVRTLASVAVTIPAHPATADNVAPVKNDNPYRTPSVHWPVESGSTAYSINNRRNILITKTDRYLYSVTRKARLPDLILSEILFIISFPLGWLFSWETTTVTTRILRWMTRVITHKYSIY